MLTEYENEKSGLNIKMESPNLIVVNDVVYELSKREGYPCESCDLKKHCRGNMVVYDMCMKLGFTSFKRIDVIDDAPTIPESYGISRELWDAADKRLKQIEIELQKDERNLILCGRICVIISIITTICWILYAFQHK